MSGQPLKHSMLFALGLFLALASVAGAASPPSRSHLELVPLGEFGKRPADVTAPGQLSAVAVLADGSVAELDETGHRILVFNGDGTWRGEAGGFGFGAGGLRSSSDLTSVGFELWASDPSADRIVRFDQWLAPLEPFTTVTSQNGSLSIERPVSAARSVQGDVVVLEGDRADGLLIDPEGRLVERIATFGQTGLAMMQPRRVEPVSDQGFVIVDPGLHAAVLLDRFGTYRGLRPWKLAGDGPWGLAAEPGRLWLSGEGGVVVLSDNGSELGQWTSDFFGGAVTDLAIRGNQLIAASGNRLLLFRIKEGGR